jgi:hypothetical protein
MGSYLQSLWDYTLMNAAINSAISPLPTLPLLNPALAFQFPDTYPSLGGQIPQMPTATEPPKPEEPPKTPPKDGQAIEDEVDKVTKELGMGDQVANGGTEEDVKKVIKKEGEKQGIELDTEEKHNVSKSDVTAALNQSDTTGVVLLGSGHAVAAKKKSDVKKVAHQNHNDCWAHAAVRAAQASGSEAGGSSSSNEVVVADSGDGTEKSLDEASEHMETMIRSFKKKKTV